MTPHRTGRRGFTVIELIIVVAIIGIIGLVVFYAIGQLTFGSREDTAKAWARSLQYTVDGVTCTEGVDGRCTIRVKEVNRPIPLVCVMVPAPSCSVAAGFVF